MAHSQTVLLPCALEPAALRVPTSSVAAAAILQLPTDCRSASPHFYGDLERAILNACQALCLTHVRLFYPTAEQVETQQVAQTFASAGVTDPASVLRWNQQHFLPFLRGERLRDFLGRYRIDLSCEAFPESMLNRSDSLREAATRLSDPMTGQAYVVTFHAARQPGIGTHRAYLSTDTHRQLIDFFRG